MNMTVKSQIKQARTYAQSARCQEMLAVCQQITDNHSDDVDALLDVGVLLLNFGYMSRARACFERARSIAPKDLRPVVNMANLARDAGDHTEARRLYAELQIALPNHPVIRRNFLVSQEYDPLISDQQRLQYARAVGYG